MIRMRWLKPMSLVVFLALGFSLFAQVPKLTAFKLIILGAGGGIAEDNLNGYLLAAKYSNDFVCLDAGTLYSGIEKAEKSGKFYDVFVPSEMTISKTNYIFTDCIKAYLISHAHLDHFAGLVIASPADKQKPVYGSQETISFLTKNIFNWEIWPNFTDSGEGYRLKKYSLQVVNPDTAFAVENTSFKITPFVVSHQEPYTSTAFLIEDYGEYLLYLGDAGSDEIEKTNYLLALWKSISPLINQNRLHAILMECSYPNSQPDHQLYGHLNPTWMMKELTQLAEIVNPTDPSHALSGLKIIVTGIKPGAENGLSNADRIHSELLKMNILNLEFVIPEQSQRIEF